MSIFELHSQQFLTFPSSFWINYSNTTMYWIGTTGLVRHSIDVYHTVLFQRIHGEECDITPEPLDPSSSYPSLLLHIVIEVFRCLETQDEFYFKNGLCQARIGIDMSHPCYQLRVPSADIDKVFCPIPTYFFLCAFLYLVQEFTLPKFPASWFIAVWQTL